MQTGSEARSSQVVNKKRTGGKNVPITADSPRSEIKEGKKGAKSKVTKNDQRKVDIHRESNKDQ